MGAFAGKAFQFLFEKVFTPLLFSRDTSNGLRILGCSYFFLIHWQYHDFYCYSWEIGSLFFTVLKVFYYFYLPAFKMLSFSLWSWGFTEMYLGYFCLSCLWFIGLLKMWICSLFVPGKSHPKFSPMLFLSLLFLLSKLRCMLGVLIPVSVSLCSSFIYSMSFLLTGWRYFLRSIFYFTNSLFFSL